MTFDLDPSPEVDWRTLAGTAELVRSELSRVGLRSWLKSTGGKGLHVVVPFERRLDWDETKRFAQGFSEYIARMEPRLFTTQVSLARRTGRILIDYLRNARGNTAIAPFSTRRRPGAPVAVPLHWGEIEDGARLEPYTMRTVMARLSGSDYRDPWAEIRSVRQSITVEAKKRAGLSA